MIHGFGRLFQQLRMLQITLERFESSRVAEAVADAFVGNYGILHVLPCFKAAVVFLFFLFVLIFHILGRLLKLALFQLHLALE